MALTKSAGTVTMQAVTSLPAGNTINTGSILIGYGCSIVAAVTNGATGPTAPCVVQLQVSPDNSVWWGTDDQRTAPATAGVGSVFCFNLGVGGNDNGDWNYARITFSGNTGQAVTIQAHASTTSAI